ncbi:MAG TPA: hypothetical protein VF791_00375 [Pyrinomonadaceae bacterium]
MSKKSTTKQPKKSRAELRAQLARDLAAALANPEIPVVLYNKISAAVTDFQSTCIDYNAMLYSAETIGKALEMFAEQGGTR